MTNRPIKPNQTISANQPINRAIGQHINQPTNQPINRAIGQHINQPTNRKTNIKLHCSSYSSHEHSTKVERVLQLSASLPTFSVLRCPCPYRSLSSHSEISSTAVLSSNALYLPLRASNGPSIGHAFIRATCPAYFHFHFGLVTYSSMSATLVLSRMMHNRTKTFLWSEP